MRKHFVAALAALAASTIVVAAAGPEPVKTDAGLIAPAGNSPEGIRVFRGIPFGAPPVGPRRWKAPEPVAHWDGVRTGDQFGPVCVQPKGVGRLNVSVDMPDSPKADEDCLYLNVWTGATRASERRPVMVWIFGGAYTEGAGSSRHNDGEALARKGVVTVTFNYRLGPFGFFSHPDLDKESEHNASGNQAVWDCLAALKWVQTNIAAFGGDPANVTIFGESAGSALSAGLVGTPAAKGLFHRAISESGAWMGLSMAPMRMRASAEGPGSGRGAQPMAALPLSELRGKSTEEITKGLRGAGMIVDGWAIPEDESITFANGRQNAVDILIGSNKDEGSFNTFRQPTAAQWTEQIRGRWKDLADGFLQLYPHETDAEAATSSQAVFSDEMAWHMRRYALAQAAIGKRAYLYYFTHEPPTEPGKPNLRATHTAEIPYVFNNLKAVRVYPDTSSPELSSASDADRKLADIVSSYWVNFAKTGDPNGKGLAVWPQFKDKASGRAMELGDTQQPQTAVPSAKFALYDEAVREADGDDVLYVLYGGFDPLVATVRTVSPAAASPTVVPVLVAISFSHLLNDTIQSLLPAIYPILKSSYQLSFSQVGLMTLTLMVTASVLQPIVGLYTDRRATPYSLVFGMTFSLLGLLLLSVAGHLATLLLAAGLIGVGSAVFHPESSRVARMASGGRHGLAQSVFQVGGNVGSALGPLLAAFLVLPRGQSSIAWASGVALLAIAVLWKVGGWSSAQHRSPRLTKSSGQPHHHHVDVSAARVRVSIAVLVALIFSKYFYLASLTNYYTFYLINHFQVSVQAAQIDLFIFLGAVAAGTILGGPIGDRVGRKLVIWVSILGVFPFTFALPYADLFWTRLLTVAIGLILASAFSAIVVYAQELMPGRIGLISGLFFGFAFGMGGLGAAVLGRLADATSIVFVYKVCAYLPLIGLLTGFLPDLGKREPA